VAVHINAAAAIGLTVKAVPADKSGSRQHKTALPFDENTPAVTAA
jgi:hypothetical protein